MPTAPYPIDPALVAITIAYRNTRYIADSVLPRVPVGKQEFKYWEYPIEETFQLPDTKVGRRGSPNEIDLTATEKTDKTEDHGLDDPIPQADIDNAPPNHNPVDRAVVQLTDYILLAREKRTADLVFAAAGYPTGQKVQLAGNDQWSVFAHADSDPIEDIVTGLDTCLIRPNVMVIGQTAWSKLSRHPKLVKAIHGNEGDTGIARRAAVAELFELEEILVGESRLNTAKKGQPATLGRVWGKHCALLFRDKNADTRSGITFGYTAEWGGRIAGQERDSKIGLRGGVRVRVGEGVREKIVAGQCGYFIEDAVA
jgi:hypothetical protein